MSGHTTVLFKDLQKSDNWSANFWVNMQKEFDSIKGKTPSELVAYSLNLIKYKGDFIGLAIKKMQGAESIERSVASAVYDRIEKALAVNTHIQSHETPTIGTLSSILKQKAKRTHKNYDDPLDYESRYLGDILKIRAAIEQSLEAGNKMADEYVGSMLKGDGGGYLYQVATILSFANNNYPDDVLKESYAKLMEALGQYNSIAAATSGDVIILPHAPIFKEGGNTLEDDAVNPAKPN